MTCERCTKPAEKAYDVTKPGKAPVRRLFCESCRTLTAAVYKVRVSKVQPAREVVAEPEPQPETPASAQEEPAVETKSETESEARE